MSPEEINLIDIKSSPTRNLEVDYSSNDIEYLVSNHQAFNDFVYTPLSEAINEIENRKTNQELNNYLTKNLSVGMPLDISGKKKYAILSRPIITPNYELRRFTSIVDSMDDFIPVVWEYTHDKFTPNMNESKYHLGKMGFYFGRGKKSGMKIKNINITDFNSDNGKKMTDVKTLWGQGLVEFHHEIFNSIYVTNTDKKPIIFDGSEWFAKSGNFAKAYYKNLLAVFLSGSILFENFLLDSKEISFTRDIFLPAFIQIKSEIKLKPLIVALEPTEIEGNEFWMYYPGELKDFVELKQNKV